jgi:hypothetical protein
MRLGSVALAICGVLFGTKAAHAERVALIKPDSGDPVLVDAFNRLKAELDIHHFDAEVVDANLSDAPADKLAEIAQRAGALASIAFVHHGSNASVDVWLADRVSGKTSMRRLEVGRSSDAASLLSIRAVDLLRASLLEVAPGKPPPADVVDVDRGPVPNAARVLAAPAKSEYALRVEGTALFDGSELGLAFGPGLGFHRRIGAFELGLMFAGPLMGTRFRADRGAATARQELGWLDSKISLFRSPLFEGGLDLGFGAHFLQAQGQAEPPLRSRSDSVWGVVACLGAHARVDLSSAAALGVSLRALGMLPKQGIALMSDQVELAQPLFSASAGVIVGL